MVSVKKKKNSLRSSMQSSPCNLLFKVLPCCDSIRHFRYAVDKSILASLIWSYPAVLSCILKHFSFFCQVTTFK